MKALIWFLCCIAYGVITVIANVNGIGGAIPTVIIAGFVFWLARTLCKKWDEKTAPKYFTNNVYHCPMCGSIVTRDKGYCTECGAKIVNSNKNFTGTEPPPLLTPVNNTPMPRTEEDTEPALFCRKCGEKLLENSRFCRKCGTKTLFEAATVVPPPPQKAVVDKAPAVSEVNNEQKLDNTTTDNALDEFLKLHAQETIRMMDANSKSQPDNEGDIDFGLVPEKPIFTYALRSVEGEEEFLNHLYTVDGQKITYDRSGSVAADGINGMVDIYDTFLPSGQPYQTIYINMYGAKSSMKAPNGFSFSPAKPKPSAPTPQKLTGLLKCPDCGKEFSARIDACPNCFCPKSAILEELEAQKKQAENE